MPPQIIIFMSEKRCPECHSIMVKEMRETEVINGITRITIEYKCTNPECRVTQIDNFPI